MDASVAAAHAVGGRSIADRELLSFSDRVELPAAPASGDQIPKIESWKRFSVGMESRFPELILHLYGTAFHFPRY
jgi:hypothetical protein